MKRVFVAGMHHESNSFNPLTTMGSDFRVVRGEEALTDFVENDPFEGVVRPLLDQGYDVVASVACNAVPNGEVEKDFYMKIKDEIINTAKEENAKKPFDGVALSLHGSMRVKDFGEAEGPLLEGLREALPDIPIYCALDMHTTMTQKMFDNCDGFVGYKCAPHTDRYDTGVHAAKMLIAALEDGVKTYTSWVKIPVLIAGEQSSTTVEPEKGLVEECRQTEKEDGIYAASYFMGFPWADNPDSSCAVHVVADSQEKADAEAIRLAELFWSKRHEFCFQTETYPVKEALDVCFDAIEHGAELPIYLSDSGDNPTAGSTSDCTGLLRALIDDPRTDELRSPVLYGGIYDPEATHACKGNVGEEITINLGAKFDTVTTEPITATGTVIAYTEGYMGEAVTSDVALFETGGVDIVLTDVHVGYTHPTIFAAVGRNAADADIVVCKLGYLTAAQSAVAKRSIMVLSTGSTNEDLATLPYHKIPRPIFPLEDGFEYSAAENLMTKTKFTFR